MNKVEKVSIGGYAFTMDADAYERARNYINELEKHYSSVEGGKDILEGIEERMAELMLERCGVNGVVSSSIVAEATDILGHPEAIDSESDTDAGRDESVPKRLYRDLSDRMVSGVCSGLAAYSGIDPALVRLVFVVLTGVDILTIHHEFWGFIVPLTYIVLWICMPGAKTVQQRCAMRGEDISLEGISRNVRNGANEIGAAARDLGNSRVWPAFWKFCMVFCGLLLLITGICVLTAGSACLIGWNMPDVVTLRAHLMRELSEEVPGILNWITNPWMIGLLVIVCFLPFLGMLYEGLHLILGFKSPEWHPGLCMLILWMICAIALGVLCSINVTAGLAEWWI